MKRPYLKFYTSDWRGDVRLRSCSLAARGLWVEMIAIMHEAEPYGHMVLSGRRLTMKDAKIIASQSGCDTRDAKRLLQELHENGVFSLTDGGVIFSRRMVRDAEQEAKHRANGSRGGSPVLKGSKDTRGVNPPGYPGGYPNALTSGITGGVKAHDYDSDVGIGSDIETGDNHGETPRAGAREEKPPDPVADFVRWFVAAGVERKVVAEHLDFELEVKNEMERSLSHAKRLLSAYGRAECEKRTEMLFASLRAKGGRGYPQIRTLSDRWTWFEPRTEPDSEPEQKRGTYRPGGGRAAKIVPGFDPMAGFNDPSADNDDEQDAAGGAQ